MDSERDTTPVIIVTEIIKYCWRGDRAQFSQRKNKEKKQFNLNFGIDVLQFVLDEAGTLLNKE